MQAREKWQGGIKRRDQKERIVREKCCSSGTLVRGLLWERKELNIPHQLEINTGESCREASKQEILSPIRKNIFELE